jgi:hypothetical protein
MNYHTFLFLLLLIFLAAPAAAQYPDRSLQSDTLALVDDHPITYRDLFERISLMPFEEKIKEKDFRSLKRKAVESLVGERILSSLVPDNDPSIAKSRTADLVLEHLFVRDAYFKRMVRENAVLSEQEISRAMRQLGVRRKLLVIKFPNEQEGRQFSRTWSETVKKKKQTANIFASRSYTYDTLFISFGSADSVLEEAAYRLKDPSEFIAPIRSVMFGIVGAALLDEEPNPSVSGKSFVDQREMAQDMLRERKETQLQFLLFGSLVRGQEMQADTVIFYEAAKQLHSSMLRDSAARKVPAGYRYLAEDITSLIDHFSDRLDTPIIRGTFGTVPLGIFLEHLYFYEFSFPDMRGRKFVPSFFQLVRAIAEAEIVAQEGYRRGVNYDPEVRRDMSVWTGYRRSRTAEFRLSQNAVVEDWEPYAALLVSHPELVRSQLRCMVREIVAKDSLIAGSLAEFMMRDSIQQSIPAGTWTRPEWKNTNGRSGWISFSSHPEVMQRTMDLSTGTVSVPYRTTSGFGAVQLLERTFIPEGGKSDSLLTDELLRLLTERRAAAVTNGLASAAVNRRITIRYETIDRMEIPDVNMITRRIIGFGGRMNAAPVLMPQFRWVEQWNSNRQVQP